MRCRPEITLAGYLLVLAVVWTPAAVALPVGTDGASCPDRQGANPAYGTKVEGGCTDCVSGLRIRGPSRKVGREFRPSGALGGDDLHADSSSKQPLGADTRGFLLVFGVATWGLGKLLSLQQEGEEDQCQAPDSPSARSQTNTPPRRRLQKFLSP